VNKETSPSTFNLWFALGMVMWRENFRRWFMSVRTSFFMICGGRQVERANQVVEVTRKITLLKKAMRKYAKALEIKRSEGEALFRWGNALGMMADLNKEPDQEILLNEPVEKYGMTFEIKPDKYEALNSWIYAFSRLADLHVGPDRETLLKQAIEKYARALEIKTDYSWALYNWGNELGKLADLREGHERC
jgi:tetratricopeptide (TPR) repeat protein